MLQVTITLHLLDATCALAHATLRLNQASQATLDSLSPGFASTLSLSNNSMVLVEGDLNLSGNSLIMSEGPVPNKLVIARGALLTSTNLARIEAAGAGHLLLDHSGVIRAHQGSLTFQGTVDFASSAGLGFFETADTNSLIVFASPIGVPQYTIFAFGGPGTNRLAAGGDVAGRLQLGFADQSTWQFKPACIELSGALTGSGLLDIVGTGPEGSSLLWVNGRLGIASISIAKGGTLFVGGDQEQKELFGCTINNAGFCSWTGQPLVSGAGAVLNILETGKLDIQKDSTLAYNQVGARLAISNSGILAKSGGTGETSFEADVFNQGSLELLAGTLRIQGALVQSSGHTELKTDTVLVAPVYQVDGGTLSGSGKVNALLNNNGGVLMPGANLGVLTVGNLMDYQQGATGKLQAEVGGSTPGIAYDQLVVQGKAVLSGTLELQFVNGFVPQAGQGFDVLQCAALSGKFSNVIAPSPAFTAWVTRYTGTNVLMLLAGEVTLSSPSLAAGQFRFAFPTTPGVLYQLQTCPVVYGNWEDLRIIPGDGAVQTVVEAVGGGSRFFRLVCK